MKRIVPMYEVEIYLPSGWQPIASADTEKAAQNKAELFAKIPNNHGVRTVTRRGGSARFAVLREPSEDMTPKLGLCDVQAQKLTLTLIGRAAVLAMLVGVGAVLAGVGLRAAAVLGYCGYTNPP